MYDSYMIAWDNPHMNNERKTQLVKASEVAKFIEALVGQGCPCGYWPLNRWQAVKNSVTSGKYKLST